MTTTPREQDVARARTARELWQHRAGVDGVDSVELDWQHLLDAVIAEALATARAEEREACIAMVRERVERFRLSEPEGAAFLSALEHALTRRAEES